MTQRQALAVVAAILAVAVPTTWPAGLFAMLAVGALLLDTRRSRQVRDSAEGRAVTPLRLAIGVRIVTPSDERWAVERITRTQEPGRPARLDLILTEETPA